MTDAFDRIHKDYSGPCPPREFPDGKDGNQKEKRKEYACQDPGLQVVV